MPKPESSRRPPSQRLDVPLESLDLLRGIWSPQPIVSLPVRSDGHEARLRFLVDTGAAITMIPKWIADAHGLPNDRRRHYPLQGLGGTAEAYLHEFKVFLCGAWHSLPCAIAHSSPHSPLNEAVVGRAGIIDHFVISIGNGRLVIERA
jgi:hypothetical protein